MENCSTKPVCHSTAHQYCQPDVVRPVNFKCILICYLSANRDFIWQPYSGVKSIEVFCYLCVCVGFFSGILGSLEFKVASDWTSM